MSKNYCGSCKSLDEIVMIRDTIIGNWVKAYYLCKSCIIRRVKSAAEQTYFKNILQEKVPNFNVYTLSIDHTTVEEVQVFVSKLAGSCIKRTREESTQMSQNSTTVSQYVRCYRGTVTGGGMPKLWPRQNKPQRTFYHIDTPEDEEEEAQIQPNQNISESTSSAAPSQLQRTREKHIDELRTSGG